MFPQDSDANLESYKYESVDREDEQESLLPTSTSNVNPKPKTPQPTRRLATLRPYLTSALSFLAGGVAVVLFQFFYQWSCAGPSSSMSSPSLLPHVPDTVDQAIAPPYIGSTEIHHWPPPSPTNDYPERFPTKVGYPGPTGTGAEPGLIATAPVYPVQSGAPVLVPPQPFSGDRTPHKGSNKHENFDMFKHWGNLSPWYSVEKGAFGVETGPETPAGCSVTEAHILHRHGARYPTESNSYGSPAYFATKIHNSNGQKKLKGKGELAFLNEWTYKLGHNVLTPFGRQQLFDLGVGFRVKYGYLLETFKDRLPVFRTESQDRMLASATNFALGFFGWPLDGQFLLEVTIEQAGFNNTLAPYKTCPNSHVEARGDRGLWYLQEWTKVYLQEAVTRLNDYVEGIEWGIEDVYNMQLLCAYETVGLGYSAFCSLFTIEEWEGFEYALDLYFFYTSGFGSPLARPLGAGYVRELLARLTHTPIAPWEHNTSTNSTLDDDPLTFPLDQRLYVDATHEVVVVNVLAALNLTGGLGGEDDMTPKKINKDRRFISSRIAPFATNVQFQILSCPNSDIESRNSGDQIRIILNDAPVALAPGINGCPTTDEDPDGLCPVDVFVAAQKEMLKDVDWEWSCYGDWDLGPEWSTTTGDPPSKDQRK